MRPLLGYFLTFGWVFFILGVTLIVKKGFHTGDEVSRKIVHISVAFAWIPMYLCFGATVHLVVPPAVFIGLNYISYKRGVFSAMERTDKSRQSPGTVYYAVSMTLMALYSAFVPVCLPYYGTALFCMALGDGFAPIFGSIRKGNRPLLNGRTLYGSISVFALCLLVIAVMASVFALPLSFPGMLLTALVAAVLELVGVRGLDNMTLPLGVFLTLFFLCR